MSYRLLTRVLLLAAAALCGCANGLWTGTHEGVRYAIHKDQKWGRIAQKGDGPLMYDSPMLTVVGDDGRLTVNGQDAGRIEPGDEVRISKEGRVTVNGQPRDGQQMQPATGSQSPKQ